MKKGKSKRVVYGEHAQAKFAILRRHGFEVSRKQVNDTVRKPEKTEEGYRGRKVAQRGISESHVLRVVYEERLQEIKVVTFYPGRRDRYESKL
jgi:hypothetical protein